MPRIRFAIALLVPEPAATEIDGLRRALGDRGLANVVPHVTLISPVNIAEADVAEVLAGIRAAAAETESMTMRLGPPTTFAPVSPVVYLAVQSRSDAVRGLQAALRRGPLERPLVHEFVPHVTITEDCPPDRIQAALHALGDYETEVGIDRLHLLRDHAPGPRRWNAVADAVFEPPLIVGTGGLPVEISVSALADPEVLAVLASESEPPSIPAGAEPIVVVARRDQQVLAAARGWTAGTRTTFVDVVGDRDLERQLLRAATRSGADRA